MKDLFIVILSLFVFQVEGGMHNTSPWVHGWKGAAFDLRDFVVDVVIVAIGPTSIKMGCAFTEPCKCIALHFVNDIGRGHL